MSTFTAAYSFDVDTTATVSDAAVTATDVAAVGLTQFTVSNPSTAYATNVLDVIPGSSTESATRYFSLTITAPGAWQITGISIQAARGGSSTPRGFAVRTSVDGFAADLVGGGNVGTVRPTLSTFAMTPPSATLSGAAEIRVLPYTPASNATIEFDNLVITGTYTGAGPATVTGAAALAASSTVTATASTARSLTAAAPLAATSTLAAAATRATTATAALAASSVTKVAAQVTRRALASMSASTTLAATAGPVTRTATAHLSASSAVAADATVRTSAAATSALAATSTLAATATVATAAAATLAATSRLTGAGAVRSPTVPAGPMILTAGPVVTSAWSATVQVETWVAALSISRWAAGPVAV